MLLRGPRCEIQPKVEGIEVAPAVVSRLCADAAIDEQRYLLLRHAAVRAQRNVEPRQVMPVAAGADDGIQL